MNIDGVYWEGLVWNPVADPVSSLALKQIVDHMNSPDLKNARRLRLSHALQLSLHRAEAALDNALCYDDPLAPGGFIAVFKDHEWHFAVRYSQQESHYKCFDDTCENVIYIQMDYGKILIYHSGLVSSKTGGSLAHDCRSRY